MNSKLNVLLIGSGNMSNFYAEILSSYEVDFSIFGNTYNSCSSFARRHNCLFGSIECDDPLNFSSVSHVIIATPVSFLFGYVQKVLLESEALILVEKPGAADFDEIQALERLDKEFPRRIFIAYNRRFYNCVAHAQSLIVSGHPVQSVSIVFNERVAQVEKSLRSEDVKSKWILSNSSHVIDLGFFLAGAPKLDSSAFFHSGGIAWHSSASVFASAGETESGALFTCTAAWGAPGGWSVNVRTDIHDLTFCPLEKLIIRKTGSDDCVIVEEGNFKFGLEGQLKAFLFGKKSENLCSVSSLCRLSKFIWKVGRY